LTGRVGIYVGRLALGVALLALWQYAPGHLVDRIVLASPSEIVAKLDEWARGTDTREPVLWSALWTTVRHLLVGVVGGTVAGLVLSLLLAESKVLAHAVEPTVAMLDNVPRVTLIPLFVLWLGPGDPPIYIYALTSAFFPVFFNSVQGWRSASAEHVTALRLMGAGRGAVFWEYRLPHALPYVATGVFLAIPLTMVSVTVGELIGGTGVGELISRSRDLFDAAGLYAATAVAATVGILVTKVVEALARRKVANSGTVRQ
jgi:ABC-type nitrate/sulfonate/bicarbonate transport system permease component